jgi:hypothetical protein
MVICKCKLILTKIGHHSLNFTPYAKTLFLIHPLDGNRVLFEVAHAQIETTQIVHGVLVFSVNSKGNNDLRWQRVWAAEVLVISDRKVVPYL